MAPEIPHHEIRQIPEHDGSPLLESFNLMLAVFGNTLEFSWVPLMAHENRSFLGDLDQI